MNTTGESDSSNSTEGKGDISAVSEEDLPRGGIVTARGTGDGLVVRLDCRAQPQELEEALTEFLDSRRGFLQGNGVYLEWVGSRPTEHLSARVVKIISEDYGVKVLESRSKSRSDEDKPKGIAPLSLTRDPLLSDSVKPAEFSSSNSKEISPVQKSDDAEPAEPELSLFDGIKGAEGDEQLDLYTPHADLAADEVASSRAANASSTQSEIWDDPDARIVYGTLRSGQKIETEHSLVICGDVNSGADIVAGGDIMVLGTLRGVAHAGAYDETGGGRFIFALDLRPTQLRIGTVISRGAEDKRLVTKAGAPEIAKIEGNIIVVEPYRSRVSPRSLSS